MSSCDPQIATIIDRAWTVIMIFLGAFLGYFFSRIAERGTQRLATYDEATRFLAIAWSAHAHKTAPDQKFFARAFWVNRQIADRFSTAAYEAWRKVENFVTNDGSLPSGKNEGDYEAEREKSALRNATRALEMVAA